MVCRVVNAVRIGKKEVNPRLLKVFVSILQEKILQNKMKLRDKNHLEHIRSIIV